MELVPLIFTDAKPGDASAKSQLILGLQFVIITIY